MTKEADQPAAGSTSFAGTELGHPGRLRRNAIGLKDALIIGLASSGPTASIALTLGAIVSAASYAGPIAILVCFLPMLGIALAYRRLNMAEVSCGASYTWAAKALTPYVGFTVGWIMLLGYFLGTISDVLPIGPYALQVIWPSQVHSNLAAAISGAVWLIAVTVIAYIGIKVTARFQWLFATVEYTVITVFAVIALIAVFRHWPGTSSFSGDWFSWSTLGGTSGLIAGILVAVYMFSGWDSSIYVNEETIDSRVSPGRAAVTSVVLLAFMYAFYTFAFQGVVSRHTLVSHADNALFLIVHRLVGSPWDKLMILAVLLSIVGATQTAMVSGARIAFAMADDRVLPSPLARTHPQHRTPHVATLLFAGLALIALFLYLLGSSTIQGSFDNVISSVGLLFAVFYAATGITTAVYFRNLALQRTRDFFALLIVPAVSGLFLLWVAWRSIPGLGGWGGTVMRYLYVMLGIGLVLLLVGRFVTRSPYFAQHVAAYSIEADRR